MTNVNVIWQVIWHSVRIIWPGVSKEIILILCSNKFYYINDKLWILRGSNEMRTYLFTCEIKY